MVAKPKITIGIPYHYRIQALIAGEVEVEGYDLDITHDFASPGERHHRFTEAEFEVGEFSAATFLRITEAGCRFLALPIFFSRGPRQRCISYREGSLTHPSELRGKKIGLSRYGASAVVWARGFLLDEYGLKTTDMEWYVSGHELFIGQDLPVKVERPGEPLPFGQDRPHLYQLLSEGKLDGGCA